MAEAMPLIIDYSFNSLGLERIEGFVETKNTNCIKVLNKLNFNLEKKKADCHVKNGKRINSQRLKLPTGKILNNEARNKFEIERIKIDVKLAQLRKNI